jgi:hypothetical protein
MIPPHRRFLDLLRTAALVAVGGGAAGSVGFMLYAGQRIGSPRLLLGLFALWVVSPFVVLALGYVVSTRWSDFTRATLYGITLAITVASLVIYAAAALGSSRPKTVVFVIVAPASWLLATIGVATAALVSRRSSFSARGHESES